MAYQKISRSLLTVRLPAASISPQRNWSATPCTCCRSTPTAKERTGIQTRHTPIPPPQSPDDYLQALARALRTGEFGRARQLATEGAARYPDHAELAKSARVLAPPTVTRASRPLTADIRANRVWLKAHRQDYAGQWIALRDGYLLAAAPSFDALVAHVDETRDVLMTKLPA
jgi:hypothetical protein